MKKLLKLSMLSCGVTLGIMASSGAIAQGACTVDYASVNSWGNGAQIKTTITNTSAAKTSWELCWTYAGNDTIANLWDGVHTQTGKNVCVKNAGYNANLPANGSVSFGFIVNNPGTVPSSFTLNGVSCGGIATSSVPVVSSSSRSSTPTTSSRSSSSVANTTAARWLLDATNSTFNFVTVKKSTAGVETPESMTFSQLQGTVSSTGQATLTIPLASISTGNVIRDPRMQSLLFESAYLPSLHFTTQLDLAVIDAMAAGSTSVQSVTGNLVLHGIVKSVVFDALVVKHANNSVSFSPRRPIVINSVDFDLNAGVEALRAVAGLSTVGEKVPVYFKMFLNRDNPTNVPAISLATAPNAAISLSGTVSNATGAANLNWTDVSNNETGFLVRRKGADGRWMTTSNNAANTVSFIDSLTAAGSYDYKVISYADSIPATATGALTLVYA
ncbi:MAG: cellulose binding domain-containing protein, partial [Fluviicoccus sp.]|uniref:cellulose binding domain-containing protein n=1 Tax=Fluviicoccus sp. TaxID=2003552 RepID=UPI0027254D01